MEAIYGFYSKAIVLYTYMYAFGLPNGMISMCRVCLYMLAYAA